MDSRHAFPLLAMPLLLAAACTGVIAGEESGAGSTGGMTPGDGVGASGGGTNIPKPADTSPFSGPIVSVPATSTRFVRLNHLQYENTVRDVLRLSQPLGLADAFIAEPLLTNFDTNGSVLTVPSDLRLDYQTAAETLGATVAHDPAMVSQFAPDSTAKTFIESFGLRAFRRPLTPDEVSRYQALFDQGATLITSGDNFVDGVELVVSAMFQSPHFLYRTELSSAVVNGKIPLTGYEIATRLSYALTNTMPDDQLFTAAAGGQLGTREGVLAQAERLITTAAGAESVKNFHDQLLVMREYETISKNEDDYPQFVDGIAEDLKQEALTFVDNVIFTQNKGLSELLTAPYTFANSRVRDVYGLPEGGDETNFARVELDPTQRAGLLTQAGFLATHGEQETPNIIIRGVHIARRVLCLDLPPPPDNVNTTVPPLEPDSTNRQRIEELTSQAACAGCHQAIINPLGIAFESLDGVGRYRTTENGHTVDPSGTYTLDEQAFNYAGPVDLIKKMAASYQAHACYSRNWIEYLYGRSIDTAADADLINQAGRLSRTTESVQDLVTQLLATEAFTSRLP